MKRTILRSFLAAAFVLVSIPALANDPTSRPQSTVQAQERQLESRYETLARRSNVTKLGAAQQAEVSRQKTAIRDMIHRRQELEVAYAFNGLAFGCKTELVLADPPTLWGREVVAHVVDPRYALDLDRPEDWAAAEARMREILEEEP
mgnify:CR=1 FL=1